MENLVEPIKLTEPVKPVQNQSSTVNQQKPQQQDEQTSGKNDFQTMLDKQVQERRLQEKKLDANKQQSKTTEKSNDSKQAKTEANTNPSVATDQKTVESEATDIAKVEPKPQLDQTKHTSAKKQAVSDPKLVRKADDTVLSEQEAEGEVDTPLSEQTKPNALVDANQQQQHKGVKHVKGSHRAQAEKASTTKVELDKTSSDVVSDKSTVNTLAPKRDTTKQSEQYSDAGVGLDDSYQQKQADAKDLSKANELHSTYAAQAHIEQTASEEDMPDHHLLNQAPRAEKLIKSAEKQLLKSIDQTQVKTSISEEPTDDMERLAQSVVQDDVLNKNTSTHSAIAELQKAALEKQHQAKQLQKDMSAGQLRSAMTKEGISERGGLETEVIIPRSDRGSDFMQTMSLQAATIKSATQRPVQADAFKTDELKSAANKTTETPTPLASTQTTVGASAALQPSSVMAAAPLGSSNQIYAYPGKSGWNQAISQKVMYMVGASEQTARLSLNPPELGPIQVVIEVNDEKADTTFISDNEEVRQALEDGMDHLREKMDEAGIALGEANVNDGQHFNQQRQHEDFAANAIQNGRAQTAAEVTAEEVVATTKVQSNSNSLVDTFA